MLRTTLWSRMCGTHRVLIRLAFTLFSWVGQVRKGRGERESRGKGERKERGRENWGAWDKGKGDHWSKKKCKVCVDNFGLPIVLCLSFSPRPFLSSLPPLSPSPSPASPPDPCSQQPRHSHQASVHLHNNHHNAWLRTTTQVVWKCTDYCHRMYLLFVYDFYDFFIVVRQFRSVRSFLAVPFCCCPPFFFFVSVCLDWSYGPVSSLCTFSSLSQLPTVPVSKLPNTHAWVLKMQNVQ